MRHISLLILLACLSSCSGPLYVVLYNNSDFNALVVLYDEQVKILPGQERTFAIARRIDLLLDNQPTSYPHLEVPGKYYALHRLTRYKIKLQLQSNSELILLLPKEKFPVGSDFPQPDGFPLKPLAGS